MANKSELFQDDQRAHTHGLIRRYIQNKYPNAHFRSITANNTDDLDLAVDIGSGERFVRVSFEAALEVPDLGAHLTAIRFLDELAIIPASEQVVITTTGLRTQAVASAFR
jgi:hypothetical protein